MGAWIRSHQSLAVGGLFVVAIAVGGVLYFRAQDRTATAFARDQLNLAHGLIVEDNEEGAKTTLATLLEQYGSTVHSREARLLLGELYLRSGEPEQAQVVLEPVGSSPDSPLEFQAAALLAIALEQDGRSEEAVDLYLALAETAELSFQARDALEAAARILTVRRDLAGAAELYQRILDGFEESDPGRDLYVMRLQEARTELGS